MQVSTRDTVGSLFTCSTSSDQPLTTRSARYGGSNMHGILTNSEYIPKSTHETQSNPITQRAMIKPLTHTQIWGNENTAPIQQQETRPMDNKMTRSQFTISHEKQTTEPIHTGKSILKPNKNASNISLSTGAHEADKVNKTTIKLSDKVHKNQSTITSSEVGFASAVVEPPHTARAAIKSDKNTSKIFTDKRSPNAKISGKMHVKAVEHHESNRPQTAQGAKKNQSQISISNTGITSTNTNESVSGKQLNAGNKKNISSVSLKSESINTQKITSVKRVRSEMENILQQNPPTPAVKQARSSRSSPTAFKPSAQNILSWN